MPTLRETSKQTIIRASGMFYSTVNGNQEIATQQSKRKFFLPYQYLNLCPLKPKASVPPISYTVPSFENFFGTSTYRNSEKNNKIK